MLLSPFCGTEDFTHLDFGYHWNHLSLSLLLTFTFSESLVYHLPYTPSVANNGISSVHLLGCSDTPVCVLDSPLHKCLWCVPNYDVLHVKPQILILQGARWCLRFCIVNEFPKDVYATRDPLIDHTFSLLWKVSCHMLIPFCSSQILSSRYRNLNKVIEGR